MRCWFITCDTTRRSHHVITESKKCSYLRRTLPAIANITGSLRVATSFVVRRRATRKIAWRVKWHIFNLNGWYAYKFRSLTYSEQHSCEWRQLVGFHPTTTRHSTSHSPNLVLSRRCGRACSRSHFRLRRSRATASERAIVRATHRATSQIFINILTSYAVLFRMRSRFARKIDVVNQSTLWF